MTVQISGTTGASQIQDGTVTNTKLGAASVTGDKLSGAQTGSAPIYGCRAWCIFNGATAGTNAPTAGGNVTSVTKNGTGDYTINLTTAMPSANYSVSVTVDGAAAIVCRTVDNLTARTTSLFRINTFNSSFVAADPASVQVFVIG